MMIRRTDRRHQSIGASKHSSSVGCFKYFSEFFLRDAGALHRYCFGSEFQLEMVTLVVDNQRRNQTSWQSHVNGLSDRSILSRVFHICCGSEVMFSVVIRLLLRERTFSVPAKFLNIPLRSLWMALWVSDNHSSRLKSGSIFITSTTLRLVPPKCSFFSFVRFLNGWGTRETSTLISRSSSKFGMQLKTFLVLTDSMNLEIPRSSCLRVLEQKAVLWILRSELS